MTVIIPSRPARPIVVEGQAGRGLPPGGTAGQALIKSSGTDFAAGWGTASAAAAWGGITGTLGDQADLQAALDAKQATLVSGTNIKTLNGSTILGSGDLVISASAAWGGITGTLSAQTDLNTALGLKANTSSLAAVATSGSASDLGSGTLPAARLPAFGSGDVSFASGGGAGTIAAGAVTLAKQANMATASVVYRKTAGSGAPEVQTLATLKTDLGLTGTNSGDQTITLTGMVTGSGTGSFAASLGSFTKAQLDAAVSDGNVLYVGDVTTNATHTGDATGATALTLATVNANVGSFGSATQVMTQTVNAKGLTTAAANVAIAIPASQVTDFSEAVDDRVAALAVAGTNMTITYNDAAGTLTFDAAGGGAGTNLSYTAATRVIASDTGTDATLPLVTSGEAGLAPASGGGTTNFLRADGTWAAPSGGGGGAPQIMSWVI